MAVSRHQRVDDPADVIESGQTGSPRQPTPTVEFSENPSPGVESRADRPVRVTDVDGVHQGLRRPWWFIGAGRGMEVDKMEPPAPVASRTPVFRPSADITVTVDPDIEGRSFFHRRSHTVYNPPDDRGIRVW
jgi:hypothetical protein